MRPGFEQLGQSSNSRMQKGQDVVNLNAEPHCTSAVHWSEDNLLAIASGNGVTLINPAALDGPRGATEPREPDPDFVGCNRWPDDAPTNAHYRTLTFTRPTVPNKKVEAAVRAIAWSPVGCSATGGCLLTLLMEDSKVTGCTVLRPPTSRQLRYLTMLTFGTGSGPWHARRVQGRMARPGRPIGHAQGAPSIMQLPGLHFLAPADLKTCFVHGTALVHNLDQAREYEFWT